MSKYKKIAILGGGESGVGTAILALQQGYDVFVSDFGKIKDKYKAELEKLKVDWEETGHTESKILDAHVVMKSPGIPDNAPLVLKIKEKGIPVISEIEFAADYTSAKIIGITGSNGKTTITKWVYHILKNAGLNVSMAGNVGDSFAKQVAGEPVDYFVLELSSFQLDGIVAFRPDIAVLANITPDHLDRYNYNLDEYVASKFRITMNQNEEDFFIYDADDEIIERWLDANPIKAQKLPFSLHKKIETGAYLEDNNIKINLNNNQFIMPLVNEKVKAIVCLGVDNSKIFEAFGNCVDTIVETHTMQEAVNICYQLAERGNTVLLSPACASFDLFENYEDRGRQFKESVRNL